MGADFVFAITPVGVPEDVARQRIAVVPRSDLGYIADVLFGEDSRLMSDEDFQEIRDYLHEAVDVVYQALEGERRDAGWWKDPEGLPYVVTGGMTWGDDPTDAWRPVMAFDMAELGIDTVQSERRET